MSMERMQPEYQPENKEPAKREVDWENLSKEEWDNMLVSEYPRLVNFAKSLARTRFRDPNPEEFARDIAHDAMVKASSNYGKFRGESALNTWLDRIAINEALSTVRKEVSRRAKGLTQMPVEEELLSAPAPAEDIVDKIDRQRLVAIFEEFLNQKKIKSSHADVLRTYIFDDIQEVEASEKLGIPVGTYKSNVHRGLEEFRKFLSRYPDRKKFLALIEDFKKSEEIH